MDFWINSERSYVVTISTPSGSDGFDLLQLGFHALDDVERVLAVAHHDDSADGVAIAVEIGDAAPDLRAKCDGCHVAQQHRRARSSRL